MRFALFLSSIGRSMVRGGFRLVEVGRDERFVVCKIEAQAATGQAPDVRSAVPLVSACTGRPRNRPLRPIVSEVSASFLVPSFSYLPLIFLLAPLTKNNACSFSSFLNKENTTG
jgi:hypothetical protein